MWIIRHGQRVDEGGSVEEQQGWRAAETKYNWHDPPLTARGKAQAAAMATEQAPLLATNSELTEIICSPFKRALQTAEPLSAASGLPIRVVGAIGGCTAAAKMHGMGALANDADADGGGVGVVGSEEWILLFNPKELANTAPFLNRAERRVLCPTASWTEVVHENTPAIDNSTGTSDVVKALFHEAKVGCVVVAHRELMYDFGVNFTPEYCSVLKLRHDKGDEEAARGWRMLEPPQRKSLARNQEQQFHAKAGV